MIIRSVRYFNRSLGKRLKQILYYIFIDTYIHAVYNYKYNYWLYIGLPTRLLIILKHQFTDYKYDIMTGQRRQRSTSKFINISCIKITEYLLL